MLSLINKVEESSMADDESKQIYLNDLLGIDKNSSDYKNGRITLNVKNDPTPLEQWMARDDLSNDGLNFSFYPYKHKTHKKDNTETKEIILHEGELVVVAVKMPKENAFLLVSVNRVGHVYLDENPHAERTVETKYEKWFGRVIFKVDNKKAEGYNFYLRTFLDRSIVLRVLDKPYDGEPFVGYENVVNIQFRKMENYLNGTHYGNDWREHLSAVKGIYCIRDKNTKKVYIGQASGQDGLAQRLDSYIHSSTGGNMEFIKLFNQIKDEKGDEAAENYFKENFYYSILETISKDTDQAFIDAREKHWKQIFWSKDVEIGLNDN